MKLGGASDWPVVWTLVGNLWKRLAEPSPTVSANQKRTGDLAAAKIACPSC